MNEPLLFVVDFENSLFIGLHYSFIYSFQNKYWEHFVYNTDF